MKSIMKHLMRTGIDTANFEQMNALPVAPALRRRQAQVLPGHENTWYEYVPASYDGAKKVPLVVQVHGGGTDGARWAQLTIWHMLAERYGFVVIYPNSLQPGIWNCDDEDVEWLRLLIERACATYVIDRERIYMTGMSNGDMMTLAFSMAHPEMLAAAAFITGPSTEEALDGSRPTGALPIIQMRGELDVNWRLTPETKDVFANRYEMNDLNREIWLETNGTQMNRPCVSIRGKDNFVLLPGQNAPILHWEIQGMGHREPIYSAQVLWDVLFSACRRGEDGQVVYEGGIDPIVCDNDVLLLAVGSNQAWAGDHPICIGNTENAVIRVVTPAEEKHFCSVKMNEMCETEAYYAPVELFEKVWDAEVALAEDGASVSIALKDGRKIELFNHSLLWRMDGVWRAMQKPCIELYGTFYFPIEELTRTLFQLQISTADDVLCLSGHYAELGRYTARLMSRLLGGNPRERHENSK